MSQKQITQSLMGGASLDLWWAEPGVLAGMPMPLIHAERRESFGGPLNAFSDDLPLLIEAGLGAVVSLLNIAIETSEQIQFLFHPRNALKEIDGQLSFFDPPIS